MTEKEKENTLAKIAIMQAYLDGKSVQFKSKHRSAWADLDPALITDFNFAEYDYRVKSTYRPYKGAQEFTKAVIAKGPILKDKTGNIRSIIGSFGDICVFLVEGSHYTYETLLKNFCWASDGSPCGILEE